jgi:hypothetical protein
MMTTIRQKLSQWPMSIEGGGQGGNPDVPKPPNHEQSQRGNRAQSSEVGPFKLYRDPRSRTNWTLEAEVDGFKWSIAYTPRLLRFTRAEFIESLRASRRILEEDDNQQEPGQGSEPDQ